MTAKVSTSIYECETYILFQLLSQNETPFVIPGNTPVESFFKLSPDATVKKAYRTAKEMSTVLNLYSDYEILKKEFGNILREGKAIFTGRTTRPHPP